jgi:hypothetical protein
MLGRSGPGAGGWETNSGSRSEGGTDGGGSRHRHTLTARGPPDAPGVARIRLMSRPVSFRSQSAKLRATVSCSGALRMMPVTSPKLKRNETSGQQEGRWC